MKELRVRSFVYVSVCYIHSLLVCTCQGKNTMLLCVVLLCAFTYPLVFIDFPQQRPFMHHPPLSQVQVLQQMKQTAWFKEDFS